MNKTVFLIIIIGSILIVGIVFGLWTLYKQPPPEPTPTPLEEPTPTSPQGVLDRIEAAIRAKLKR